MYPVRGDERERGGPAVVALMGAVALSGCSGPRASSIARRRSQQPVHQPFSSAKPGVTQPASPTPSAPEVECPGDIRTGASTLEVAAKSEQPTAGDLRYQLVRSDRPRVPGAGRHHVHQSRRQQGRVILGPMGAPGQINVPLRYAVVREGPEPKTIATKFKRLSVAVPADQTHMQFVDVEEGLSSLPAKSELGRMSFMSVSTKSATRTRRSLPRKRRKLAPRPQ